MMLAGVPASYHGRVTMSDGEGEAEKTMTVDIHGQTLTLPIDQGKALIAGRDAATLQYNEAVSLNEAKEAATKKAEDDAKLAEETRLAEDAAKNGELDELKRIQSAQLALRDNELKKLTITSAIGQHEGIARTALPDIAASLSVDSSITLTDGNLLVKKNDGSTQAFGDFLSGWLADRPHYTVQQGAPASNAGDKPPPDTSIETMTMSAYNKLSGLDAQSASKQMADGKLKLID